MPISNTVSAPVIAKRSAETVVVTPNGQTVVIGGLMETQQIENVQKIPLLGDIPPRRSLSAHDQERCEEGADDLPHPDDRERSRRPARITHDEINQTDLVEQAFTPQDFDKYLGAPELFPTPERKTTRTEVKQTSTVRTSPPVKRPPATPVPAKARATRVTLSPK